MAWSTDGRFTSKPDHYANGAFDPNRTSLCDRGDLPSCALPQLREDVVARGTIGKIPLKKGEECESPVLRQPIRIPSGSFKIFSMQQHIDEPAIGLYNDRWQPQLQPFRRHRVKLAIPSRFRLIIVLSRFGTAASQSAKCTTSRPLSAFNCDSVRN